jgi:predicted metallo-beta-lactamase superfamily hydrolase
MRKGFVVREKGYEYNDNWYDHDPGQDKYTELFNDRETALKHAQKYTSDFLEGRRVYDYFNEKDYLGKLKNILNSDEFNITPGTDEFNQVWELIKEDIGEVLEVEIEDGDPCVVSYSDGTKMYYKDNVLHRIGKPAIERPDGTWSYFYKGAKHRVDGPAEYSEYSDEGYYIDGEYYWNMDEFKAAAHQWLQEHRDYQIESVIK